VLEVLGDVAGVPGEDDEAFESGKSCLH
jgi:hypothetical protein